MSQAKPTPYEIRPFAGGDEVAILALYEKIFGVRQSIEQWRWRFVENPHGAAQIQVAWNDDRCIGQFAYSAMPLTLDGAPIDALMALDGMIDPEHQRSGLFSELERRAGSEIPDGQLRYGFPNDRSYPLFIGKLGWRTPGVPQVFVKLLGTEGLAKRNRLFGLAAPVARFSRWRDREARGPIEIRQFSRFEEVEGCLERLETPGLHLRREVSVLNWRYRLGPHPYRLYAFGPPGAETGFAVVRVQEKFGLRIAWLAELATEVAPIGGPPAKRALTMALRTLASELYDDADLLSALLPQSNGRAAFRSAGFYEAPRRFLPHPFFLITRGDNPSLESCHDLDRWPIGWGLHDAV